MNTLLRDFVRFPELISGRLFRWTHRHASAELENLSDRTLDLTEKEVSDFRRL